MFCCRYTEAVEDKGRPDAVVAAEAAATYKLRNDSCIADLCSGMFRSTVVCPDCGKVSKAFDPCVADSRCSSQRPRPWSSSPSSCRSRC